jgi:hypothetical protein
MSTNPEDMKAQLTENLKDLHLPTMRGSFEEQAQRAQQESQSYERYPPLSRIERVLNLN